MARQAGAKAKTRESRVEQLAAFLAIGGTVTAGAASLKIPERTARRIASTPEFTGRVRELRAESIQRIAARAAALAEAAEGRLARLIQSNDEAIAARAAAIILRHLTATQELAGLVETIEDLARRLDRLDEQDAHRKGGRGK